MTLGSLFDGIGTWQLAAVRNGINPVWSSEIDDSCKSVTAKHFPDTVQLGDIRHIDNPPYVDIITAGFPCQNLSFAGDRAGLAGKRSCLFYDSIRIIRTVKPKFAFFENVVGLLSSNRGLDFHSVLEQIAETEIPIPQCKWANAGLVECSDRQIAWRILDSQYFGLPQRRKRIFIVCSFGTRRAAQILFESESLRRYPSPRSTQKYLSAFTLESRAVFGIESNSASTASVDFMPTIYTQPNWVVYGLGRDAFNCGKNAKFTLSLLEDLQPPLTARGPGAVFDGYVVRRLTPLESERLMGLPDYWTAGLSDAQRYKMIGNSMALHIADWLFRGVVL